MSGGVLALKYRPKNFEDVVGQNHVKPILRAIVKTGNVPSSIIFSGTRGTGKTTCARIFAAALNCTAPPQPGEACGSCGQCVSVQMSNSNSVLEIDAASNGGVEEVRKIKDLCSYAHEGEWRVILLDEAHSMSKEAYNALLKLMEEPPANTVIVLVTTEPEKILGTVRSRSMTFEFRRIKNSEIAIRLRHIATAEGIEADDSLLVDATNMAQGSLRDAVMVFDQVTRIGVSTASQFREFYGIQDYSVPLMWAALRGDFAEGARLIREHFSRTGEAAGMVTDLSRLVTDLLVIKSEGRPADRSDADLEERVDMSQGVSTEALVTVCEVLWDLKGRTRATENDQRSSMDMAFALIANTVRPVQPSPTEPPQPILEENTRGPLTLAEISDATRR